MFGYIKMSLSHQAIVLIVCNFVVFMLMFINVFIPRKNVTNTPSKTAVSFVLLLVILPIMILQIYSLNCMVTGECYAWSWTLSVIAAIFTIIYVIGFILTIVKLKQNTGPTIQQIY